MTLPIKIIKLQSIWVHKHILLHVKSYDSHTIYAKDGCRLAHTQFIRRDLRTSR